MDYARGRHSKIWNIEGTTSWCDERSLLTAGASPQCMHTLRTAVTTAEHYPKDVTWAKMQ